MLNSGDSPAPGNLAAAWRGSSFGRFAASRPGRALAAASLLFAVASASWLLAQSPDFLSGYDFVRMHAFYKAYFREAVLAGRLPLWNPYAGLGRPFLADIETQTLYPPNLLVLFGVGPGIAAALVLHQALAFGFGCRLGRVLGAGAGPSLVMGAGLALASPFTARLATGMVPVYFSLCWWPALLWLGARLQDRWSGRTAGGLGLVCALCILAGNPPVLFVELFGLLVFLACRFEWPHGALGWRQSLGRHAGLALGIGCGALLAGMQLLPFAELVGQGNRPLHSDAFALSNGMPAASWLSLIMPTTASFGPNWEFDLYCGLVPLFAAACGWVLWRERNARALMGLGLAGALLAAGDRAPFLGWVIHLVPGAAALRLPSRYGIWCATAVMGLAALTLTRRPRNALLAVPLLFAVAAGWTLWLRPYAIGWRADPTAYYGAHLGALGAAALVTGLWLRVAPGSRSALLATALAAFCLADWGGAIRLQAPAYSANGFHTRERQVRAALEKAGLLMPLRAPPRISFDPRELCENAGMTVGFSTYNAYSNPALRRVWSYLHAATGVSESAMDFIRLPDAVSARADRLVLAGLEGRLDPVSGALSLVAGGAPRAFVAFDARVVADWQAAESEEASGRASPSTALLESASAPAFTPGSGGRAAAARVTRFEPEKVVVRVDPPEAGILVLSEAWYPGWTATVGGVPARVFPVNGWMRGVVVPGGGNEVVFRYHSERLPAGVAVSLLGAALLAALVLLGEGSAAPGRGPQTDSRIL